MTDALAENDWELARVATVAERLAQALELMRFGVGLKRSGLRRRHPTASETEIDTLLGDWLRAESDA